MLEQKNLQAIAEITDTKTEQDSWDRKMEMVKSNLEELDQYYRINNLGNNNTGLLLERLEEVQKRLEELEGKIL